MGDAPAIKAKASTAKTAVRVRANAHVDVADLAEGSVSKTTLLRVSPDVAAELLARHPYLEATEG